MRIQRTSRIITVSVTLLAALTIVSALISLYYRALQEEQYAARRIALKAIPQLAGAIDRLTAAVRGYAATGDRRYYEDFQRELNVDRAQDRAVEGLMQLGLTSDERALMDQAKRNSDQLVKVANSAFETTAGKDSATAIALVYGDEFQTANASALQSIAEC